ncbi:hypothetical protein DY000_02014944 [Brassica cretica]|uniref:Uncharacterized protein n=1 Tax=Brassica cretica TaxID=69181 RepID=A0ABQ7DC63_BRACR|nr:hypothetical protein DY000_02014944 [Brassica cretica]
MQTNKLCLTLIDKNAFNDPVRVIKEHASYIELGDDPKFAAAIYSDSGRENEDDHEVSIDTQPESVDTLAFQEFQEAFTVEDAATPRRNICVIAPDEYVVYRDEEGNTHAMESIYFQMPKVHLDPPYPTKPVTSRKYQVEEMIAEVYTAQERMFDDFCRSLDATYYPLNNSIRWLRKCMEELELKVDYTHSIIQRHEEHKTRGEEAIKSFVGT